MALQPSNPPQALAEHWRAAAQGVAANKELTWLSLAYNEMTTLQDIVALSNLQVPAGRNPPCAALPCPALPCPALHCDALRCTALRCAALL